MATLARLLEPPRLRTIETDRERRATWLELFFDLVFVVAVAELGHNLDDDPTLGGFLGFVALFVPVWWAWAGFTFYANRFDTDDLAYRLVALGGMLAVAALATTIHNAFDDGGVGFALAYVSIRLIIVGLYLRAIRHVDEARPLATLFATRFSLAVVIWLLSLAVEPPARWWLWALALFIELSAPVFGWRLIPRAPIHPEHVPERFGLLTIIVLGESIIAVVLGVANETWTASSAAAAVGGFVCAAALWWIYFDFLDASMVRRGILSGLTFTYAHFPIVVGQLAILGEEGTAWILCAGLALASFGMALIQLATPPALFDADVWLRLGAAAYALSLVPVGLTQPPLLVVWLLALPLVAIVAFELARHGHGELDLELGRDEA